MAWNTLAPIAFALCAKPPTYSAVTLRASRVQIPARQPFLISPPISLKSSQIDLHSTFNNKDCVKAENSVSVMQKYNSKHSIFS